MTDEQIELSVRLVEKYDHLVCFPATVDDDTADVIRDITNGMAWVRVEDEDWTWLPDLSDDATGWVLLALVEDWVIIERGWDLRGVITPRIVVEMSTGESYEGTTLAEACARALLGES